MKTQTEEQSRYLMQLCDKAKQADELRQLLREVLPILRAAFFANHVQSKKADELYDRIRKAVRE